MRDNSEYSSIYNFLVWADDLASAGQPEQEELEALVAKGYNWVINIGLLDTDYALKDEAGLAKAMGVNYTHIPVLFDQPTQQDFETFCDAMEKSDGYKRFVHCAANYRATVFIAMYLYLYRDHAYEEVMSRVYDIWQPNKVWQNFINGLISEKQLLAET